MKPLCQSLATALLLLAAASHAQAADQLRLHKSVRTLENLQDAVAGGDAEAASLQARLIGQIETDIRLMPDADLQRPQNLYALATLLLSGANPNLVEAHIISLEMDGNMRNLLAGALAYARADRNGALNYLAKVAIEDLPPHIGGRVALVRSIIGASNNPARAIDDLYLARKLMPGTLVEEASLRRCVFFAAKVEDVSRLQFCAARYVRRFSSSLYWDEFAANLAAAVAQTGFGEGAQLPQLQDVYARLPAAPRRSLLLQLARASLTHGRTGLATSLAGEALPLCRAASTDMARARLYLVAAGIAGDKIPDGGEALQSIEPARLDAADAALLAKVRSLMLQIAARPDMAGDEAVRLASSHPGGDETKAYEGSVQSAERALSEARKLVKEITP